MKRKTIEKELSRFSQFEVVLIKMMYKDEKSLYLFSLLTDDEQDDILIQYYEDRKHKGE